VIAFLYCADELFSFFTEIENYTPPRICCSGPGDSLSPPPKGRPGSQPQQNRETRPMRMISEKAIAFLLAVAISGTAFNTFIV
jgi:hypothetical protein